MSEKNRSSECFTWPTPRKSSLEAYEEAKEQFESLSKDLLDAEKARKRLEKKGGGGDGRFPGSAGSVEAPP